MKRFPITKLALTLLLAVPLLIGCGHKQGDGQEETHGNDDGHGHEEESPAGASFKPGKGVIVTEETKKLLNVEIADVTEQKVMNQLPFTMQVFGEKHHLGANPEDHSACDVHGSGLLSTVAAMDVKAGDLVEVLKDSDKPLLGAVLSVQKALAMGESEIVVGISNASSKLQAGEFVPARVDLPREEAVTAIPQTALLETSEGTFVYTVNGEAYFRTAVKIRAQSDGWVEVTDGLLPGDQVVVTPVKTLWLIELRATKGGGHSH